VARKPLQCRLDARRKSSVFRMNISAPWSRARCDGRSHNRQFLRRGIHLNPTRSDR
jgi:hypothetical protein